MESRARRRSLLSMSSTQKQPHEELGPLSWRPCLASAIHFEQGIAKALAITSARHFPKPGSFVSLEVKAPTSGGYKLAFGVVEVSKDATGETVPEAGGAKLLVFNIFFTRLA